MINVGIQTLLPKSWKAVAWIDADLEFESTTWASDTLKILNGCCDIVQLFSHCSDLDPEENPMRIFQGFGFQYSKHKKYSSQGLHLWHPGFAWACTRKAYERMGGLYDKGILGAGDHAMSFAFIGNCLGSCNPGATEEYKQTLREFEKGCAGMRLGYVPGVIRHHFHGAKKNRQYSERWKILINNNYSPQLHMMKEQKNGLLVPTAACPPEMLEEILTYFRERNEDEGYAEA
jgi:hypothetical protein